MLQRFAEKLKRYPYATVAALILAPCALFAGILQNGFVYDDGKQILENPFVVNARLWPRIFSGSVWSFMGHAAETNFYRPLHIFSYWLVYRLAGPDPAAFHLFQLVFYAATVWVVFRIGRELLGNELAAFLGALLWALHPLHVEAVAWLASVPDAGCAFFYLLAFLLFLRAEKATTHQTTRHCAAALAYFPALFFKEMSLSLPLLVVAAWLIVGSKGSWTARLAHGVPYVGAAACYVAIRVAVLGHVSGAGHLWGISLNLVGAALGLLGEHTRLFFWPANLNVFRTFDPGASLRSVWPWATLLVLLATCWFRKKDPRLAFLVLWWPVTLAPCLDVRQLSFPLVAERFSYLPSVGLCLALAYLAVEKLPAQMPKWDPAPAIIPALALLIILWGVQDLRAVPRWRNNEVLWSYSLKASPNAGLVHAHQGLVLQYQFHDLEGASREYKTALELNHSSFRPLNTVTYDSLLGLGQIAALEGRRDEALSYYNKAVRVLPGHSLAYNVLGAVYFPRGDYSKAAEYFSQAVKMNPQEVAARFYLGTCYLKMGKFRESAEQFRAARETDPSFYQAYEAEAQALEAAGDSEGAASVRREKPRP